MWLLGLHNKWLLLLRHLTILLVKACSISELSLRGAISPSLLLVLVGVNHELLLLRILVIILRRSKLTHHLLRRELLLLLLLLWNLLLNGVWLLERSSLLVHGVRSKFL